MSDLTDGLRVIAWSLEGGNVRMATDVARAADMLDAIDALHGPYERAADAHWCRQCLLPWPCSTHRILHPEETE